MTPVSATVDGVEVETTNAGSTPESLTASLTPPEPADTSEAGTPPAGEPAAGASGAKTKAAAPAATTEPAEPDPASEAGKQLAKRRQSMQYRIDQVTWEKHEAKRKADALEAELAALKNPAAAKPPTDPARPTLKSFIDRIGTDFDTYEDAVDAHAEALTDYKLAVRDRASSAAQFSHARETALHQTSTRGAAEHADFDAVLGQFAAEGGRLAPSTPAEAQGPLGDLEQVILGHPKGHSVAYHVAKDPELRAQLLGAPTRMVFMEVMGELLTRLKGAPTGSPSTPAPVSRAKPPVQPAKGQPQATGGPPGDDASDEEHLAYYNQQERAARRRA